MKQNILYPELETPAVLLDLVKLEANINEMSRLAAEAGVKLRPHTKCHQSVEIAKMQIEAGACGIEVGPIEQAAPMAKGGIKDILVAHPFYGSHKLARLKALVSNPELKITVVVDMIEQAEAISQVGEAVGRKIPTFIKIDTGVDRYGVLPGEPALNLAKKLSQLPGIELVGMYAHESGVTPTQEGVDKAAFEVETAMVETVKLLRSNGLVIKDVAVGASPTFPSTCRYLKEGKFPEITELHPGARTIGDIRYMASFGTTREACALTVLTTVVSTSHPKHVVIDAGFKTFSSDVNIKRRDTPGFFWNGKPSYGSLQGRTDLWFGRVGAETGLLYYMADNIKPEKRLSLGDRLEIVPNDATTVVNIHETVYGVRNGRVESKITITGREQGS